VRCEPDLRLKRATELTPKKLEALGVKGLLLDLDNTLLAPKDEGPLPEEVRRWAEALKQHGIGIALVTNAKPRRVRRAARELGVPGAGPVGKPLPFGFYWGLKKLKLPKSAVLAVGDQVFTDLLGARLAGLRFALVEPLDQDALRHTRWLRTLESRCLKTETTMGVKPEGEGAKAE